MRQDQLLASVRWGFSPLYFIAGRRMQPLSCFKQPARDYDPEEPSSTNWFPDSRKFPYRWQSVWCGCSLHTGFSVFEPRRVLLTSGTLLSKFSLRCSETGVGMRFAVAHPRARQGHAIVLRRSCGTSPLAGFIQLTSLAFRKTHESLPHGIVSSGAPLGLTSRPETCSLACAAFSQHLC